MSGASTLTALRRLTADGWPASVREIMAEAGDCSPSTTQHHLQELQRRGLAEQHPRRPYSGWRAAGVFIRQAE